MDSSKWKQNKVCKMNKEFSLTIVSSCINNIAKFSFVEQVNLYSLPLYESRNSPVNL